MQVGRKCSMNVNTGTYGTPIWSALGRISSPKINLGRPTSRKTYRESRNSKNVTGMLDVGFTFTYIVKGTGVADTILDMLYDSLYNDTVLDMAALDKTSATGAKGIRGPFLVSQLNKTEDDEDAVSYECTVVECEDDVNAGFKADAFTVP